MLPPVTDPNLLVGTNTADDAGVYKLNDELAIVYTIDILTPAVNDAYTFGKIAAANCISDVYAMGGDPKIALNIVGFPGNGDPEMLGAMLKGGSEKAQEAGVTIAGGHTFVTPEIKYGLTVIGYIHPEKIITNAGAQPGDRILLTKPIGIGTMIQALMVGKAGTIDMDPVIETMESLNRDASCAMRAVGAHAATDITGYGLVGHLVEMAEASNVGIVLQASNIPLYEDALAILEQGIYEPGIVMNLNSFKHKVDMGTIKKPLAELIFGSETSGGLAVVIPDDKIQEFTERYGKPAPVIGSVTSDHPGRVMMAD
jgi:selenide,water dikinase